MRRNIVGFLALFIALGGTSIAASNALLPRNSVGTAQIKNGAVTKKKISKKTVRALTARGPVKGDPGTANARAFGLTAWTFDPREWDATHYTTQVNARLVGIWLPAGARINYLAVPVSVAGAGLTSVELGIYDKTAMAGGGSPPVARTGNIRANFLATGWRGNSKPLGFVAPYTGRYYLASAYAGRRLPTVGNAKQTNAFLVGHLPNGVWTAVHAQPQGTLPNAPASTGTFMNVPVIIAY